MKRKSESPALRKLRDLVFGEQGGALAVTLAFLLPVYLFILGIYAVSETIRRKIELQNAADAAAYSAAVVQADYMSRIATLNKAITWCYADTTRRQLDWAVAAFTDEVLFQLMVIDSWDVLRHNLEGCTLGHANIEGVNYNAGWSPVLVKMWRWCSLPAGASFGLPWFFEEFNDRGIVERFAPILTAEMSIVEAVELKGAAVNAVKLAVREWELFQMDIQLTRKIFFDREMEIKMRQAAEDIIQFNTREIDDPVYRYIKIPDLRKCFTVPDNNRAGEKLGLELALHLDKDDEYEPKKFFGNGINYWLQRSAVNLGLNRKYVQQKKHLHAEWSWFWTTWGPHIYGPLCVTPTLPWRYDYGDPKKNLTDLALYKFPGYFYLNLSAPAMAYILRAPDDWKTLLFDSYFGEGGTVVVGLARENKTPLDIFEKARNGLVKAFDPTSCGSSRPKYIWATSAARAGYNPNPKRTVKERNARVENFQRYQLAYTWKKGRDRWNLNETDWDALFVPVANADSYCIGTEVGSGDRIVGTFALGGDAVKEMMNDSSGWKVRKSSTSKWQSTSIDFSTVKPPQGFVVNPERGKLNWGDITKYMRH